MKSFNHIYEKIIDEDNRKHAVKCAIKGRTKKRRKRIKKYIENQEMTVEKLKEWIEHYENDVHTPLMIYDGISRKQRTIIVPTFKELAVQHAVVEAMKPIFLQGVYEHSYAAIPGRGAHKGKKVIEKWIRNDSKNCKYVFKMDIRHFFDSIPHDILKRKLAERVHDARAPEILYKIIDVVDVGIPLGFYTSQWFSNWYLTEFDHYIKEQLYAPHYVRYMDDIVILGSNKRKLHKTHKAIVEYLSKELGLREKDNWQVFRFDYVKGGKHIGRDIDFMGFRFFCDRTILRRSIMLKATRTASRISKKEKPTLYDLRRALSYLGWINATDTYNMYLKRVKPFANFQYCKRRISKHDRRLIKNADQLCTA